MLPEPLVDAKGVQRSRLAQSGRLQWPNRRLFSGGKADITQRCHLFP